MLDFFKVLPNFDDPDDDEYSVSRKNVSRQTM